MKVFKLGILVMVLFSYFGAFAQEKGDRVGNGGVTGETDFLNYVSKIGAFLNESRTSKTVFKTVDPDVYLKKTLCLKVKFLDLKPLDKFGVPRDAVNYPDECKIEVYSKAWDDLSDSPQVKFIFAFHEMLGLLEIETLKSKDQEVDYHLSSKISSFVGYKNETGLIDVPYELLQNKQEYILSCFEDQMNYPLFIKPKKVIDIYFTYFPVLVDSAIINQNHAASFTISAHSLQENEKVDEMYFLGKWKQYPKLQTPNHLDLSLSVKGPRTRFKKISLDFNPSVSKDSQQWRGAMFQVKLTGRSSYRGVQVQMIPKQKKSIPLVCGTKKIIEGKSTALSDDDFWLLKNLLNES